MSKDGPKRMGNVSSYDPKREFTVSSFLIVLISNCPSGGFGGPGGGLGGPGGGFRTGRSSGKPLLLPVLKKPPPGPPKPPPGPSKPPPGQVEMRTIRNELTVEVFKVFEVLIFFKKKPN